MKRIREEEGEESAEMVARKQRRIIDWTKQDRQPLSQDLREMTEEDSEDGDEIVLMSRRRYQRLEIPGAPAKKKKRRILPWTDEGRLLWPDKKATAVESESDEQASEGGGDAVVLVEDSQSCTEAGGSDSATLEESDEDRCSSFVVDDDSASVVEEETASERYLARGALQEVRASILEGMERLKRRLSRVDEQLKALAPCREESSASEGAEVVDERTCRTLRERGLEEVYPWEEIDSLGHSVGRKA